MGREDICLQRGCIHELAEPHIIVMNTLNKHPEGNDKVSTEW
jgi:hypothetical protein